MYGSQHQAYGSQPNTHGSWPNTNRSLPSPRLTPQHLCITPYSPWITPQNTMGHPHTPKFHRSLQKPMDQYRNPRSPWINHGCLVQSLYFETGVVYRLGNRMVSKSKRILRRAAAQSPGIGTYTSVNKPDNSNNNPGKWAITDC